MNASPLRRWSSARQRLGRYARGRAAPQPNLPGAGFASGPVTPVPAEWTVRVPQVGPWPPVGLSTLLGRQFRVTTQGPADIVVVADATAGDIRRVRAAERCLVIAELSWAAAPDETVRVLDAGADHVLNASTTEELAARIRALARRQAAHG